MPPKAARFKTKTAFPHRLGLTFFRSTLHKWGSQNFASFPWRTTRNKFHSLIVEVMLQRTRAEQVVPVYKEFVRRFPSPRDAARANPRSFSRLLKPLGLEWRARSIRNLVKILAKRSTAVPSNIEALKTLPGVGDYAAAAFSTLHLSKPATLIDSNIVRLYGRFFDFKTGPETRRDRHFRLLADCVQPVSNARAFGYALLDFTRSICTPKPHCDICPLNEMCHYALDKNRKRKPPFRAQHLQAKGTRPNVHT